MSNTEASTEAFLKQGDMDEISKMFMRGISRLGPQTERIEKAMSVALKSGVLDYLRDVGITQETMTDEDYDFAVCALEKRPPADNPYSVATYVKKYCFRQLKRLHSPIDTAHYLRRSYKDTLSYAAEFIIYLTLIYMSCHRFPFFMCIIVRIFMSIRLGYLNFIWAKGILFALKAQLSEISLFIWKVGFYVPAIVFETLHVLFDVFIGWPLLSSILGMFFMIYIFPIAFPEMSITSVFVELYVDYIGDPPTWVKIVTFFI